jgi:AAA family ATP:ADP antiporter
MALGVMGDQGTEAMHRLLDDPEPAVVSAAFRAAGTLKNRAYVFALLRRLSDSRVRGDAIEALSAYGTRICGTLGDMLDDETAPVAVRRQIPRVLRLMPDQRSVDALLRSIGQPELSIRTSVLKALNQLRETAPNLSYGDESVIQQFTSEIRYYFELHAALEPFRTYKNSHSAPSLLARSIEERLRQTIERLFRLLGLRYPPKEIYAAYLAVNQRRTEQYSAALEFLDNVLDRPLKRVLLPLLDETSQVIKRGHELFGIEARDTEAAVRDLIRSGDSWLVACAMAAAAELNLRQLSPEISSAASRAGAEVAEVARSANRALEPTAR